MTHEFAAISETLDALGKYCASSSRIDTLHADALREVSLLIRNLHERVLSLEARVAKLDSGVGVRCESVRWEIRPPGENL